MAGLGYISQASGRRDHGRGPRPDTPRPRRWPPAAPARRPQDAAYFCDYVVAVLQRDPFYKKVYQALNTTGGLKIHTTMDPQDQTAAERGRLGRPAQRPGLQPGAHRRHRGADQARQRPGEGHRGRPGLRHRRRPDQHRLRGERPGGRRRRRPDWFSSKLFTLVTALEQGIPFGFTQTVTSPASIGGYTNCKGQPDSLFQVHNAEGASHKPEVFTLYNGTTQSINVFFASWSRRSASATWSRPPSTWASPGPTGRPCWPPSAAASFRPMTSPRSRWARSTCRR